MKFKLEICTDSVESAIEAQNSGADRIELCANLVEGGTTPGYGTIVSARNNLHISLHVMIRPRSGDFLYSDLEYDIMRRDVEICGESGVDGIVFGILRSEGTIDVELTAKLVELAQPMTVTFHRAFDLCSDAFKGLEDVIATGASRLLTSGHKNKAEDGVDLISQLVKLSADRIIVMPGSGINESNIALIAKNTGSKEFHLSGRKVKESGMKFRRLSISMGVNKKLEEYRRNVVDPEMIKGVIRVLETI